MPVLKEEVTDLIINEESIVIELTRKQLYDEIWSISVKGFSDKYDIPYSQLMKQLKEANIPTPSSGYWTKLEFGKNAEKTPLSGSETDLIKLTKKETQTIKEEKPLKTVKKPATKSKKPQKKEKENNTSAKSEVVPSIEPCASLNEEAETETSYRQVYNIYDRKTLYNEVWSAPITRVAQKYKVSDVAIHKICKSMNIPTPPAGFWAKVRAGKKVEITPLPDAEKTYTKRGIRSEESSYSSLPNEQLVFLEENERLKVLEIALNAEMPELNSRLNPIIVAHREKFDKWKKAIKHNERVFYYRDRIDPGEKPLWADDVSEEIRPRIYRILNAISKTLEPLGGTINEDLSFTVYGETVYVSFSEAKDKSDHIPTKEENMALLKYEDEKKRYSWASKPQIRKYDYTYNGHLRMNIYGESFVRDSSNHSVEDYLGNIIIKMYEAANYIKQRRLAAEEAERKRQEIENRKKQFLELYNQEVDKTNALVNEASDFEKAQKIRNYIEAVANNMPQSAETEEWIAWARAKADWFDPTIAAKDKFFGKRQHNKPEKEKILEHKYNTYLFNFDFEDE